MALINPKNKFEISNDRIVLYPDVRNRYAFIVMAILFFVMAIGSVYTCLKYSGSIMGVLPIIVFMIIVGGLLILFGKISANKKIIFDKISRNVTSELGPFKKHLINFDEIYDINKNTNSLSLPGMAYRILPNYDKVGVGIRISMPYGNKLTIHEQEFINVVLPKLKEMVFANKTETNKNINTQQDVNNVIINANSFQYFIPSINNVFEYKPTILNHIFTLIWIGVFAFLAYYLSVFIQASKANGEFSWGVFLGLIMFLISCIYWVFRNTQSISIDKPNKIITQANFFGIYKKQKSFNDFKQYLNTKHYVNAIYTGTELKIIFNDDSKIRIANKRDTQKIQQIINELNTIIFNNK